MAGQVPLSVVILAKNEAGRIRDCIASAAWADEILVIDDESVDDTSAIATSLGGRVLRRKMDIEGRHRNWAHAQAKHEWILSLDADERVTPELAEEIKQVVTNGSTYELYAIPRRNYIGTCWVRHGGWYPSAQLKLFKRGIFHWEETTVHPRAFSDKPAGQLSHDLLHYSYRDLADYAEKLNRQTSLEAEKWLMDGRRVTLGKALWRTFDRFWRSYVGKKGYRDGFLGFAVAVLGGMYQLIAWIKYTEGCHVPGVEEVVEPYQQVVNDQERYDRQLLMSHLCAYQRAGDEASGKRVLEVGSGSGYGAFYLSHRAKEVIGIDLDAANISQASRMFRRPNLSYRVMDATRMEFPDGRFDVVGQFQVIEHLPEASLAPFVKEVARVLAPEGCFVVSTLNVEHNRKHAGYQKPDFHVKEFTGDELLALLRTAFPSVQLYGLYPTFRYRMAMRLKKWGLNKPGGARNPVRRFFDEQLSTTDHVLRSSWTPAAIDLVAICRKRS